MERSGDKNVDRVRKDGGRKGKGWIKEGRKGGKGRGGRGLRKGDKE